MLSPTTFLFAVVLSLPVQPVADKSNEMRLDRMVIGGEVMAAQYENWQARKKAFEECRECFDQPFPGDD